MALTKFNKSKKTKTTTTKQTTTTNHNNTHTHTQILIYGCTNIKFSDTLLYKVTNLVHNYSLIYKYEIFMTRIWAHRVLLTNFIWAKAHAGLRQVQNSHCYDWNVISNLVPWWDSGFCLLAFDCWTNKLLDILVTPERKLASHLFDPTSQ